MRRSQAMLRTFSLSVLTVNCTTAAERERDSDDQLFHNHPMTNPFGQKQF